MSVSDTVHTWARERLACGALARDTLAYSQVFAALPDLIARLEPPAAQAPEPTPPAAAPPSEATPPAEPEPHA